MKRIKNSFLTLVGVAALASLTGCQTDHPTAPHTGMYQPPPKPQLPSQFPPIQELHGEEADDVAHPPGLNVTPP